MAASIPLGASVAESGVDLARIEAEERLASLTDQAARFVELVAAGHPVEEAFARAGYTEGSALTLAGRPEILAAVGALRERNLGASPTDATYLRRIALGVTQAAQRDGDHRVVLSSLRLLAELDGHLEAKPPPAPGVAVNIQINLGGPPPDPATVDVTPSADLGDILG